MEAAAAAPYINAIIIYLLDICPIPILLHTCVLLAVLCSILHKSLQNVVISSMVQAFALGVLIECKDSYSTFSKLVIYMFIRTDEINHAVVREYLPFFSCDFGIMNCGMNDH